MTILYDTRERKPFIYTAAFLEAMDTVDFQRIKLDYGDYTNESNTLFIERKSIPDCLGTIYTKKNYDRFIREFERAKEAGVSMVILIEGPQSSLYAYAKRRHIRMPALHMIHLYEGISETYGIPVIWAKNREDAARICLELLAAAE